MTDYAAEVRRRARELYDLPEGTTLWEGFSGYRKTSRGDWRTISSAPDRFTSADLARMGL